MDELSKGVRVKVTYEADWWDTSYADSCLQGWVSIFNGRVVSVPADATVEVICKPVKVGDVLYPGKDKCPPFGTELERDGTRYRVGRYNEVLPWVPDAYWSLWDDYWSDSEFTVTCLSEVTS